MHESLNGESFQGLPLESLSVKEIADTGSQEDAGMQAPSLSTSLSETYGVMAHRDAELDGPDGALQYQCKEAEYQQRWLVEHRTRDGNSGH